MKLKQLLKRVFLKKSSWKEQYEVGRGTYGKPIIRHWGEPTTLKVGCFCSIASGVTIFLGGNHRTDWITTYPFSVFRKSAKHIKGHPTSRGDVIIGHDVWIGASAVILSGVRIGNGAVIGASAVVTHDVPPYSIVAGNPAEVVRMRFKEKDISILQTIEWWSWDDAKIDAAMPFLLNGDVLALHAFSSKYDLNSEQGTVPDAAKRRQ
jgi:acetyltransferase-like isoleucine patch superfamily enzyme